jgi:hypothetical protein
LIGYCNGAQLALEAALELKSRGVCAINPQLGTGVFLNVDRLEQSDRESVRSFVRRIENLVKRHRWIERMIQPISRSLLTSKLAGNVVPGVLKLSSPCPPKVRTALVKNDTDTLLLLSPEDLSPLRRIPVLGSVLRRRLASSEHFRIEIVPGLDHAFLSVLGRGRAVSLLDHHVVETFVSGSARPDIH